MRVPDKSPALMPQRERFTVRIHRHSTNGLQIAEGRQVQGNHDATLRKAKRGAAGRLELCLKRMLAAPPAQQPRNPAANKKSKKKRPATAPLAIAKPAKRSSNKPQAPAKPQPSMVDCQDCNRTTSNTWSAIMITGQAPKQVVLHPWVSKEACLTCRDRRNALYTAQGGSGNICVCGKGRAPGRCEAPTCGVSPGRANTIIKQLAQSVSIRSGPGYVSQTNEVSQTEQPIQRIDDLDTGELAATMERAQCTEIRKTESQALLLDQGTRKLLRREASGSGEAAVEMITKTTAALEAMSDGERAAVEKAAAEKAAKQAAKQAAIDRAAALAGMSPEDRAAALEAMSDEERAAVEKAIIAAGSKKKRLTLPSLEIARGSMTTLMKLIDSLPRCLATR